MSTFRSKTHVRLAISDSASFKSFLAFALVICGSITALAGTPYESAEREAHSIGIGKIGVAPSGTGIRISRHRRIILTNQHNVPFLLPGKRAL